MAPPCHPIKTVTVGAVTAAAAAVAVAVASPASAVSYAVPVRAGCSGAVPLTCTLSSSSGSSVGGTVTLTPTAGGCSTSVSAVVTGLPAEAVVGWHVHEFGDISAADGTATGGHFNPEGVPHALPPAEERHAGDLGNLPAANHDGVATLKGLVTSVLTTAAARGRGLIIHAATDDGGQPTGNAGARLAQCVLGVAAEGADVPAATAQPMVTATPVATRPPRPTRAPRPTDMPVATRPPRATRVPRPTDKPAATLVPRPTRMPRPTEKPTATRSPRPTDKPAASRPPRPTRAPRPVYYRPLSY